MTTKVLEVRDSATCINVVAIRFDPANEAEARIFRRAGYGNAHTQRDYVAVMRIDGDVSAKLDVYDWPRSARTLPAAHDYIRTHFDELSPGDVVDVEFILGEKPVRKAPEWREEWGY